MTSGMEAHTGGGVDSLQLDLDVIEADRLAAQAAGVAGTAASPDTRAHRRWELMGGNGAPCALEQCRWIGFGPGFHERNAAGIGVNGTVANHLREPVRFAART